MALVREFCAENMELVPEAIAAGAARIELCDNLAQGGTSPSFGVIRAAVTHARPRGVDVMAMARPRGGDFFYTDAEVQMMADDIALARGLGVSGVVFGCLARVAGDGEPVVDRAATKRLVAAAMGSAPATDSPQIPYAGAAFGEGAPVQVTFHMAFDELSLERQLEAIDFLAELGVQRILTHGGPAGSPIMGNIERLRRLVEHAAGRIIILPGGGVTHENAQAVADALGVTEVHGTRIVHLG